MPSVVALACNLMTERQQMRRANEALTLELRAMTAGEAGSIGIGIDSSPPMYVEPAGRGGRRGASGLAEDESVRVELGRAKNELASLRAHAASLVVRKVEAESRLADLERRAEQMHSGGDTSTSSAAGLVLNSSEGYTALAEVKQLRAENAALARQLEHLSHRGTDPEVAPLLTSVRAEIQKRDHAHRKKCMLVGTAAAITGIIAGSVLTFLVVYIGICKL
jgi:hypothetical protein